MSTRTIECKTYLGETFEQVTVEPRHGKTPPPVSLFELNHVSYESPDHEALAQFYEHVLGFKRLPRPAFKFDGAWLQTGNTPKIERIER